MSQKNKLETGQTYNVSFNHDGNGFSMYALDQAEILSEIINVLKEEGWEGDELIIRVSLDLEPIEEKG